MTKTVRDTASAAEESFNKHYAAIWGEERWASLYRALAYPTRHAALVNRYTQHIYFHQALARDSGPKSQLGVDGAEPTNNLQQLDFPTVQGGDEKSGIVCFARSNPATSDDEPPTTPGGKSIALAQTLWPEYYANRPSAPRSPSSRLVCNETDGQRQKRLAENLKAYLPSELFTRGSVVATKVDATQSGSALNGLLAGGAYDKVLVDAPCSSERHIIHASLGARQSGKTAPEMANWRAGSSKRLAATQVELLMTALKAVKLGGQVMYATCSIEPTENDCVIEKMLALVEKGRKKGTTWTVELGFGDDDTFAAQLEQWAERTKHGWIVLPDHPSGGRWGPLFFAKMKKVSLQ
ncbi:hypothetical protein LTR56_014584 [Elasticomyces elasticus]|nr:hypothetical protein LTR56_014584 [Elasticomyces elasticus]KAK3646784.1 hypothetical protein LTR22_014160 [Elasticomyces elasticus]KAK4916373.1 hypothetical protein LTR49_015607 [Elasticomyces elasticus]KAK5755845.1 hypothetical protein LTS12_014076 [Elasticomyces elasticus]